MAHPTVYDLQREYGGEWLDTGPNRSGCLLNLVDVDLIIFNNPNAEAPYGAVIRIGKLQVVSANGETWKSAIDNAFVRFHKRMAILPSGK